MPPAAQRASGANKVLRAPLCFDFATTDTSCRRDLPETFSRNGGYPEVWGYSPTALVPPAGSVLI
jgi:hypothetical protein